MEGNKKNDNTTANLNKISNVNEKSEAQSASPNQGKIVKLNLI